MFLKVLQFARELLGRFLFSPEDLQLLYGLYRASRSGNGAKKKSILVQMPQDYSMLLRIAILLGLLRPRKAAGVKLRIIREPARRVSGRIYQFFQSAPILNYKWALFYRAIGVSKSLDYSRAARMDSERIRLRESLLEGCITRRSVMELSIEGVSVGDLVYDTYIRFKPAPTVEPNDFFLKDLVMEAVNIYFLCKDFLDAHPVDQLITSYTSYIYHGILARLCMARGIEVLALGAGNQLLVKPTSAFPFHKRNFLKYKKWADAYPNQDELRLMAGNLIENRILGGRDQITSFMKTSAYSQVVTPISLDPHKKSAVIMAHDFYDSPHTWGDMLFDDFYEWLDFLLATASETNHDFYVKPHPNALRESGPIYDSFFRKYPKIRKIDPSVSNLSIVRSGFQCAFTLNGTVAHEFSYLGLPTICAGTNPHSAFDFVRTAKSIDEFRSLIFELPNWEIHQEEILKFLFMHNYCFLKKGIPSNFGIESAGEARAELKSNYNKMLAEMKLELETIGTDRDFL
jgi:hypothetical protein